MNDFNELLWMEEILHQLKDGISHYLSQPSKVVQDIFHSQYHHQHWDNDGILLLSVQGEAANIEQICDEMMGQRACSLGRH